MPFKLRKQRNKDLYWVITKETGKKHSKEALPKEQAVAQMRALYMKGGDCGCGKRGNCHTKRGGSGSEAEPQGFDANDLNQIMKKQQELIAQGKEEEAQKLGQQAHEKKIGAGSILYLISEFKKAYPKNTSPSIKDLTKFALKQLKKMDCGCGCNGMKELKRRGRGRVGGALKACPEGYEEFGPLLCKSKCPDGMRGDATHCRGCPPGWTDMGLSCAYFKYGWLLTDSQEQTTIPRDTFQRIDWEATGQDLKNGFDAVFSKDGVLANALDPEKNGVAEAFRKFGANTESAFKDIGQKIYNAFDPSQNGVADAFNKFADSMNWIGDSDWWKSTLSNPDNIVMMLGIICAVAATALSGGTLGPSAIIALNALGPSASMINDLAQGRPINLVDVAGLALAFVPVPGATAVAKEGTASLATAVKTGMQTAEKLTATQRAVKLGLTFAEATNSAMKSAKGVLKNPADTVKKLLNSNSAGEWEKFKNLSTLDKTNYLTRLGVTQMKKNGVVIPLDWSKVEASSNDPEADIELIIPDEVAQGILTVDQLKSQEVEALHSQLASDEEQKARDSTYTLISNTIKKQGYQDYPEEWSKLAEPYLKSKSELWKKIFFFQHPELTDNQEIKTLAKQSSDKMTYDADPLKALLAQEVTELKSQLSADEEQKNRDTMNDTLRNEIQKQGYGEYPDEWSSFAEPYLKSKSDLWKQIFFYQHPEFSDDPELAEKAVELYHPVTLAPEETHEEEQPVYDIEGKSLQELLEEEQKETGDSNTEQIVRHEIFSRFIEPEIVKQNAQDEPAKWQDIAKNLFASTSVNLSPLGKQILLFQIAEHANDSVPTASVDLPEAPVVTPSVPVAPSSPVVPPTVSPNVPDQAPSSPSVSPNVPNNTPDAPTETPVEQVEPVTAVVPGKDSKGWKSLRQKIYKEAVDLLHKGVTTDAIQTGINHILSFANADIFYKEHPDLASSTLSGGRIKEEYYNKMEPKGYESYQELFQHEQVKIKEAKMAMVKRRVKQRTVKITPYSERPDLLSDTFKIADGRDIHGQIAGGDKPIDDQNGFYWPSSGSFESNATSVSGTPGSILAGKTMLAQVKTF